MQSRRRRNAWRWAWPAAVGGAALLAAVVPWLAQPAQGAPLAYPARSGAFAGAAQAGGCRFVLGFAALRVAIGPAIVGDCLEDEHVNPANGNTEQVTTGGLLVWRARDNWTAFTDGYRTWVAGPFGVQARLNTERFAWESDPAAPAPTPVPPPPSPPPPPPAATATPGGQPQPAPVEAALRDAAARLGIPESQLRLERVEQVDWPDSSLGCPQPGQVYLQVITPGYRVIISVAGRQLEYHTNTGTRVVLCAQR